MRILKQIISVVLLFCATTLQAQRQQFFNLTAEEVKVDTLLPVFSHSFELGRNYDDSTYTVTFKYPEFIAMSREDTLKCKQFFACDPPVLPYIDTQVVVDRKNGFLEVAFSPIVKRNGRWMKLVSFMLEVEAHEKDDAAMRRAVAMETRATTASSRYAEHSVLATGSWALYRLQVTGPCAWNRRRPFTEQVGTSFRSSLSVR